MAERKLEADTLLLYILVQELIIVTAMLMYKIRPPLRKSAGTTAM